MSHVAQGSLPQRFLTRPVPRGRWLGADYLQKHQVGGQLRKSDRFVDSPGLTGAEEGPAPGADPLDARL